MRSVLVPSAMSAARCCAGVTSRLVAPLPPSDAEVVDRPRPHREEDRRHERNVHAAQLVGRRAGQRRHDVESAYVPPRKPTPRSTRLPFGRRHVVPRQRQRRLGRVGDDAACGPSHHVRGDVGRTRSDPGQLAASRGVSAGVTSRSEVLSPSASSRAGSRRRPAGGDRRDRAGRAGYRAAAGGHVDAEHRQPEQRGLQQRLFVDAADVGRGREVVELGLDQRLADRDRGPAAPARSCRAKLL